MRELHSSLSLRERILSDSSAMNSWSGPRSSSHAICHPQVTGNWGYGACAPFSPKRRNIRTPLISRRPCSYSDLSVAISSCQPSSESFSQILWMENEFPKRWRDKLRTVQFFALGFPLVRSPLLLPRVSPSSPEPHTRHWKTAKRGSAESRRTEQSLTFSLSLTSNFHLSITVSFEASPAAAISSLNCLTSERRAFLRFPQRPSTSQSVRRVKFLREHART